MCSFLLLFIKSSVAGFYDMTFCLNPANIIPTQGASVFPQTYLPQLYA